jgi:hypothetical protein
MNRRSQHGPRTLAAAIIALSFFISCSAVAPVPRVPEVHSVPFRDDASHPVMPSGWEDITGESAIPSITLWLVNKTHAAALILRTITIDDTTMRLLRTEDICTAGHLSLRLKMEERKNGRRITRTPERLTGPVISCVYVYEEDGLLRRVIVFWKNNGVYELELMQEGSDDEFRSLADDQNLVLTVIAERR